MNTRKIILRIKNFIEVDRKPLDDIGMTEYGVCIKRIEETGYEWNRQFPSYAGENRVSCSEEDAMKSFLC